MPMQNLLDGLVAWIVEKIAYRLFRGKAQNDDAFCRIAF